MNTELLDTISGVRDQWDEYFSNLPAASAPPVVSTDELPGTDDTARGLQAIVSETVGSEEGLSEQVAFKLMRQVDYAAKNYNSLLHMQGDRISALSGWKNNGKEDSDD